MKIKIISFAFATMLSLLFIGCGSSAESNVESSVGIAGSNQVEESTATESVDTNSISPDNTPTPTP
ncbi:MAG: hypothetical protein DK302_001350, partial [Chloroflexi bacterium]